MAECKLTGRNDVDLTTGPFRGTLLCPACAQVLNQDTTPFLFTTLEQVSKYKAPVEVFWEAARFAGDGYDIAEVAAKREWRATYAWGRDGWDLLEPPYYIGYLHEDSEGFYFATNCEGDTDVWRFPTEAMRNSAVDLWAFLTWERRHEPWVEGVTAETIPDNLRGAFSWDRVNLPETDD